MYLKEVKKDSIMDITQFNKELAIRIATAKRYEKSGDIKLAIKLWLEVSEMAISLSKNTKLDASFRNMLMNRIKGIFEHVRRLKAGQLEEELYVENVESLDEFSDVEDSMETNQGEREDLRYPERSEVKTLKSNTKRNTKVIENSDLKNLPIGFKEIETSEDFEIITPHDKDFVKKQFDKAFDSEFFKAKKQGTSEVDSEKPDRADFEHPKDGKTKICFACGYDKNLIKDKVCKNCGTNLD
ncbi:MAG: hypothetical protein ACFFA4_10825 [Promethearchaeota archaeon]